MNLKTLLIAVAVLGAGCSHSSQKFVAINPMPPGLLVRVQVPGNQAWTPTGVTVSKSQCLQITGRGEILNDNVWRNPLASYDFKNGPKGTYALTDEALTQDFPIESGYFGPVPAYALIGKIGLNGRPFYVGEKRRLNCNAKLQVEEGGELYLGINDFRVADNSGSFEADLTEFSVNDGQTAEVTPETLPQRPETPRIMTIYIDGLRPDVFYEMAYNGLLPNFRKHVLDRGVFYENAFTVFPSDTITSNSAWMTGLFTDKTAVKSQSEFNRETGEIKTYLEKFAPSESANILRPVDEFRVGKTIAWMWRSVFGPKARAEELRHELDGGVKAIYDYCDDAGIGFRSGVLPILNIHPPRDWINVFSNNVQWPISAIEGVKAFDKTNADFTLRYNLDYKARVIHLWFPGNDVTGHFSARGQFGPSRRYLMEADRLLGKLVERLQNRKMYDDMYIILMADHGHMGGKDFINQRYNLPYQIFYRPPQDLNHDGEIDADSGLGFNIRKYDYVRNHSVEDPTDFAVFDIGSYGTTKVHVPFASRTAKDWRRNGYYQLTHYSVSEQFKQVNLLQRSLDGKSTGPNIYPKLVSDHPVAFVMAPVTGRIAAPQSHAQDEEIERIYLKSSEGSEALIEIRQENGVWEYRYLPVRNFDQDETGKITFETAKGGDDPLKYLRDVRPDLAGFAKQSKLDFLKSWHDGRTWLRATSLAEFPNGPEFYFKYFNYDPMREAMREQKTSDFVIVANAGWSLRHEDVFSTDHGYPQRGSMNMPIVFAGPGIHQGVVSNEPVLIADLMPTMLDILKIPYDKAFMDGKPLPGLWADEKPGAPFTERPNDAQKGADSGNYEFLGLNADLKWDAVFRSPPPEAADALYHMHDLSRYNDMHNIMLDAYVLGSYEVPYGIDILFDLMVPGPNIRPLTTLTDDWLVTWDKLPDSWAKRRTGQFFNALHLRDFSLLDAYQVGTLAAGQSLLVPVPLSYNFFYRYMDLIDWSEDMLMDFSGVVSKPFGKKDILGVRFFNMGIDGIQWPMIFAVRMSVKYGLDWADRGLLNVEAGISDLVNGDRDKVPVVLEGYPGHEGCSCNRFIRDLQIDTEKRQQSDPNEDSQQGGKGMKIPAPGVPM